MIAVLTGQRNAALDAVAQLQVVVMDLRQRLAELEAASGDAPQVQGPSPVDEAA